MRATLLSTWSTSLLISAGLTATAVSAFAATALATQLSGELPVMVCESASVSGPGGSAAATVEVLPAPGPERAAALEALKQDAELYQAAAKDYRSTLTTVVRHHFEERRRRMLGTLDVEIDKRSAAVASTRADAIARLEAFIRHYSGPNADPKATPDAMFRLAALYEEAARSSDADDLSLGLEPAINIYERIIQEYPDYEEIAGVHYYLGHSLADAGRADEAQQAWRSLVCSNKYSVQIDPAAPGKLLIQPMVQDHDEKFWNEWHFKNPVPFDQDIETGETTSNAALASAPASKELLYRTPYDETCVAMSQEVAEGEEPRYVAEVWWQLGNYHFDRLDNGGPFALNRAVSAYEKSMSSKKPPLYGVSMYKRAWTHFKQERYREAVDWFVNLLNYADEQEALTGDPGADFRAEAYMYIAGSLAYHDFEGPPGDHPNIPRTDVLDVEPDPVVAEEKMAIALERVQDASLIPQDKKWSPEIYKALAQEFIEISQDHNAIAALELTLKKFPLDPDAPIMQNRVAEIYGDLARSAPAGSAVREENQRKALEARTALARYVGTTDWTNANRDDPEALMAAETLVRLGLRSAAADHTNRARALYANAQAAAGSDDARRLIAEASAEFRLAETAWYAYLAQDCAASDTYESKFWLADARVKAVLLDLSLGLSPTDRDVEKAYAAIKAVRDSNEDDRFKQPAAVYGVTLSENVLDDLYRQHADSEGARGIERRDEVVIETVDGKPRIIQAQMPPAVIAAIEARDAYNRAIPLETDPQQNGPMYEFQAADYYFAYGHFDEARARLTPVYQKYCGKNEWGYRAWEKLVSMSAHENDADATRVLVEAQSCAFDEETKVAERSIREPVEKGIAYVDARKAYKEAQAMQPGPARDAKWRQAAALYGIALKKAPDREEAPEAAMNGAFAYKQVGDYDKAIGMYSLFISRYGSEDKLRELQRGNSRARPPVPAQPEKYEERVGYLKNAHDALGGSYVLFFDYAKAARTFDEISGVEHFSPTDRRDAAREALILYSSLGDKTGMERAKSRFFKLGASPQERAEAEFIIARSALREWDRNAPDTGANEAARRRAQRSMEDYYNRFRSQTAAAEYLVPASYYVAQAKLAAGSRDAKRWLETTINSFDRWNRLAPRENGKSIALGSPEASMAAEADYTLVDENIRNSFDYETGHQRYKGTPAEVLKEYRRQAADARRFDADLTRIVNGYLSPKWSVVALARQGTLWDSLRTGLFNTREPQLQLFTKKEERALAQLEEMGTDESLEKADAFRMKREQDWSTARDKELADADKLVVARYGKAYTLARRYNVSDPMVARSIRRLAYMTDLIGNAKMAEHARAVPSLSYVNGMFVRIRPGQVVAPAPANLPAAAPEQQR